MAQGSTMFTVGTLIRHAEEAGAPIRALVGNTWIDGVVVGADGMGVVLDDGNGHQVLARLDSIVAVSFSRAHIDGEEQPTSGAREGWSQERAPIEAGPVGG